MMRFSPLPHRFSKSSHLFRKVRTTASRASQGGERRWFSSSHLFLMSLSYARSTLLTHNSRASYACEEPKIWGLCV